MPTRLGRRIALIPGYGPRWYLTKQNRRLVRKEGPASSGPSWSGFGCGRRNMRRLFCGVHSLESRAQRARTCPLFTPMAAWVNGLVAVSSQVWYSVWVKGGSRPRMGTE